MKSFQFGRTKSQKYNLVLENKGFVQNLTIWVRFLIKPPWVSKNKSLKSESELAPTVLLMYFVICCILNEICYIVH